MFFTIACNFIYNFVIFPFQCRHGALNGQLCRSTPTKTTTTITTTTIIGFPRTCTSICGKMKLLFLELLNSKIDGEICWSSQVKDSHIHVIVHDKYLQTTNICPAAGNESAPPQHLPPTPPRSSKRTLSIQRSWVRIPVYL